MEISNAHHQVMSAHQMEEVFAGISCPKNITNIDHHPHEHQQHQLNQMEKKARPNPEQALKCPRCDSTNTKFCYYNNYSLTQPRYFCKGCRRYWTQGGSLRNVPVGGGCRKNNKRSSSSSSKKPQEQHQQPLITNSSSTNPQPLLPPLSYDTNDLSLAFASLHKQHNNTFLNPNPNPGAANFLDVLRGGGYVDSTTANQSGGFNRVAYDYMEGGGHMLLPFEGGDLNLGVATTSAMTAGAAAEGSWIGHGNNNDGVDMTRDYWNGVGSYWHGVVNSSLM